MKYFKSPNESEGFGLLDSCIFIGLLSRYVKHKITTIGKFRYKKTLTDFKKILGLF